MALPCVLDPLTWLAAKPGVAPPLAGCVMVITAEAFFVPFATEVAVSVTVAGVGTVAGAVYVTELVVTLVSVPQVAPLHPAPESDQLTPLFCESFCTEAVKLAPVETCTEPVVGLTETEIAGGAAVIVRTAAADFVPFATEVAVSVTVAGVGTAAGVVYVTELVVTLLSVPHVAPLHPAPESDQLTPLFCVSFCTDAVKLAPVETCTEPVVGLTDTEMAGGAPVTVITAAADFVPFATEVAVSVTVAGVGTVAGAVYVTELVVTLVSVPQVAPLHPAPESDQLTPLFCVSFCTEALKLVAVETCTEFVVGLTETEIAGGAAVTVMTAAADFVPFATEVAVSVTVAGVGTVAGAVYVTELVVTLVSVPQVAPLHPPPESDQLTPLFCVSFCTDAVKLPPVDTCMEPVVGLTETEIAGGAAVIVRTAAADFVPFATEVAVSVTVASVGTVAGAVYVTEVVVTLVSVPQVAPLHPAPESDQLTPLFCVSFCTEAVKLAPVDTCTVSVVGLTDTEMAGGAAVTVITAAADFVPFATEVAVSVTVAGVGTVAGAVYVTELVVTLVSVPQVAPLHPAPESDQLTPLFCESFCTEAVKLAPVETCTEPVVGLTETKIAGGAAVIVRTAAADFVPFATEVAVSVTVAGVGTAAGAVYVTELVVTLLSVPHVAPLHPAPESDQLTPLFCVSFCTDAVKLAPVETCTEPVVGLTDTEMAGGAPVTVITAAADFVPFATEVAVSVTVAGVGTVAGAVYVTELVVTLVSVPQVAPLHPAPESDQLTPLFCVSFCTDAVKLPPVDTCTVSVAGLTDTEMAGGSAVIDMVAEADFELSATEVAVSITVGEAGTATGAR